MEVTKISPTDVSGWGIDADPKNDPTYPMKNRTDAEQAGYTYIRPPQQPLNIEVLHSNERPNYTAVFGTSTPPSGLSGMLRRFAFKYSESSYGHWLPLVLADRINVVEGVVHDLAHGHLPNTFAERGGKADWKYNRKRFITRALVSAAMVIAVSALMSKNDDED